MTLPEREFSTDNATLLSLHEAGVSLHGKRLHGKPLLDKVSLEVLPGESLAIIGPNGAGKSTLLKLLAGELTCMRGDYFFLGRPFRDWSPRQLSERRAVLPQHVAINFPMRVDEVVALGLPRRERGNIHHPRVRELLARFDAEHLQQRRYPTLSGGEQQRVQLARVSAQITGNNTPSALFLDECTSALDPAHQHHVLRTLRQLSSQGTGMVWTVHDLNLAARYADRIAVLKQGRLLACGSPEEILNPALLADTFGIEVRIIHDEGHLHVLQRGPHAM